MQLNPARGRKLGIRLRVPPEDRERFMQLNPARGRKHRPFSIHLGWFKVEVYAAQPREGTETRTWTSLPSSSVNVWFMQLSPARGRKLEEVDRKPDHRHRSKIYAPQPREGTKAGSYPTLGAWSNSLSARHDDTPPCSSPVSAPHAQHISSFLMGGLW